MKFTQLQLNFLKWRIRHITTRDFILLLSIVVGGLAGLAAALLKASVHYIQHILIRGTENSDFGQYLIYFYPLLGLVLTVIITNYLIHEKLGHGITDILYAISQRSSIIKKIKTWSRAVTSAITIGFGGSAGLEAPIVVTGSAIGSNIASMMHLDYKSRTILIGSGAAGAIAGIFNSPIAGVIFSSEVILAGIGFASFIPLLIAAVAGSIVTQTILGDAILFSFELKDGFITADVPFYILLGVLSGLVSLYFTRVTYWVEARIGKVKHPIARGAMGGLLLALIIFILPPIYGEGYDTILHLLESTESEIIYQSFFDLNYNNTLLFIAFLFGIIILKPVASALTIGSGGSGGIFAPSLFLGAITGFMFAFAINHIFSSEMISLSNFTLVGMCGVMSGILHAPLTAIFLIAESTGGYTLFVPLMLVSAISYSTISYFEEYSIYTKRLIERGEYIPHDKDRQLLSTMQVKKVIEKDLHTIRPDQKLKDLIKLVRKSKRNIFPVVDDNNQLKGIIYLDGIRNIMFDEDAREEIIVSSLMNNPPESVSSKDSMELVMNKFEKCGAWNLPVIDDGKYVGFVSKSRIFNTYRKKLIKDRID